MYVFVTQNVFGNNSRTSGRSVLLFLCRVLCVMMPRFDSNATSSNLISAVLGFSYLCSGPYSGIMCCALTRTCDIFSGEPLTGPQPPPPPGCGHAESPMSSVVGATVRNPAVETPGTGAVCCSSNTSFHPAPNSPPRTIESPSSIDWPWYGMPG